MNDPDRYRHDSRPVESLSSVYWAFAGFLATAAGLGFLLMLLSEYLSHA